MKTDEEIRNELNIVVKDGIVTMMGTVNGPDTHQAIVCCSQQNDHQPLWPHE